MSKIRPKRSIAPPPSDFYESSQFHSDGYIKVLEILSHVVIERNHTSKEIKIKTIKQQKLKPVVNESVYKLKNKKSKTNFISKDDPSKGSMIRKRDKLCEWFKRFLPKEGIEIVSHEKQQGSINEDFLPSNVLVGCSRELSKPGSCQTLEDTNLFPYKENLDERADKISSCPEKNSLNELVFEVEEESNPHYFFLTDTKRRALKAQKKTYTSTFLVGQQHRAIF